MKNPTPFPYRASELTNQRLTDLIQTVYPDVTVGGYTVISEKSFAAATEEVSTAGRIELQLQYEGDNTHDLVEQVVVKVSRPDLGALPLYENEVAFYTRLRPELEIQTPQCLGGEHDDSTGQFGLALEDLNQHQALFPDVTTPLTPDAIKSLLNTLALLHARYWNTPRFETDLSWIQPHTHGSLYSLFNDPNAVPALIRHEIDNNQFKRELVERAGQTADGLYHEFRKLQQHQAGLPQTVCHGDTHIGNTYLLPDNAGATNRGGLIDWQLMSRGYCMHDVTYLLITGLSVKQRRENQQDLLRYYLEQLAANGVKQRPEFDEIWLEYRRAAVWGVYIGWLTTPIENYGWDITVNNHIRLLTAYDDLDTKAAIAELPEVAGFSLKS